MENCLFCKIVAGTIPSTKVYEDETVLAFRDINPLAPVHVLVIPKTHIRDTDGVTAKLIVYIGGNLINAGIITLCTGHDCLGHTDHIPVSRNESFHVHSFNDRAGYDVHHVIALADNRCSKAH